MSILHDNSMTNHETARLLFGGDFLFVNFDNCAIHVFIVVVKNVPGLY